MYSADKYSARIYVFQNSESCHRDQIETRTTCTHPISDICENIYIYNTHIYVYTHGFKYYTAENLSSTRPHRAGAAAGWAGIHTYLESIKTPAAAGWVGTYAVPHVCATMQTAN